MRLGFRATFVVDKESFAALQRIAKSLGFDGERSRNIQRGFQSAAELGTFAETELDFRGEHYKLGESFDIVTKCNQRDVEKNLRQIREARRQADFVIVSLHNQDTLGRSGSTPKGSPRSRINPLCRRFAHACRRRCRPLGDPRPAYVHGRGNLPWQTGLLQPGKFFHAERNSAPSSCASLRALRLGSLRHAGGFFRCSHRWRQRPSGHA